MSITPSKCLASVALLSFLIQSGVIAESGHAQESTNALRVLSCSEPVYDFGTLDNEETVEHSFVLRNGSDAVLELDRVHGCCGAKSELLSHTIPPGEETTLRISIPLKGRSGTQAMSFYVRAGNMSPELYELQIKGVALAKVDVQPSGIMLGTVTTDEVIEKMVTITCQSNVVFNVTNIVRSSPYVAATYMGVSGNVHRVSVRTVPPLPAGITRDVVRVLTDNPKYPELEIPVLARMTKDIVVFPGEIRVPAMLVGKAPASWYGVVRSLSKAPFKITGTEAPGEGIEIICSPMATSGYKVEVRNVLPQADLDGKNIILRTDSVNADEVFVPIRVVRTGTDGR